MTATTPTRGGLMATLILLYTRILAVIYVVGFAVWYGMADGLRDKSGTPLGADFINIYAAGLMALRGQAASVYDWSLHGQVQHAVAGYDSFYFGWHYPPLFLGVAAATALLPYLWSFTVYMAASFAGFWAVLRRLAPPGRAYVWALAAFPGVFDNLINGQNGFITAALFGAGVLGLEMQPWAAGLAFGLLSYKPQFFVVIPVVLAAGGYGRAFLATCATAVAATILSWAVVGTETWRAFFASTRLTRHIILEQGVTGWQKIQSVFAWTRMWGGSVTVAYALQGVMAVAALAAAIYVWRGKTTLATRVAALCAAMLLVTPYLLDYDLVILAVPLAMLTKQGIEEEFMRGEKILLAALWLLPMAARNAGDYGVPLTVPLLALLMGFCVRQKRLNSSEKCA